MKFQDILNTLLSSIKSIPSEKSDAEKLLLLSKEMVKARHALLSSKNTLFNAKELTLEPLASTLREILQYLNGLLSHTGSQHTPFRNLYGNSCLEIEILSTLSEFQFPLDHQFDNNKSVADIVAILVDKVNDYLISTRSFSIGSRNVLFFLYALTLIDCDHNPTLAKTCSDAVKLSMQKCAEIWSIRSFEPSDAIRYLWLDAKLALVNDTNQCLIPRAHLIMVLRHIDGQVTVGRFKLDIKLAKQLFQVYGMHLDCRSEFPAKLTEAMNLFLPEMRRKATRSAFEAKIESEIMQILTGYKKDKKYHYINFEQGFNFRNPINEFSLESDFEYRDPRAGIVISFQVDGKKYHNIATSSQTPARTNLNTRFRNRLFSNLGIDVVEIDDQGLSLYRQQLETIIFDKIVYPTFLSQQQERLRSATHVRDALVSKDDQFKKVRADLNVTLKTLAANISDVATEIEVLRKLSTLVNQAHQNNLQSSQANALLDLVTNIGTEIEKRSAYIAAVNTVLSKAKLLVTPKFNVVAANEDIGLMTANIKSYASYHDLRSEKIELDRQFAELKAKHALATNKLEQAEKRNLKESDVQRLRDDEMALHSQIIRMKPKLQRCIDNLSDISNAMVQGKAFASEMSALVSQDKKHAEALTLLSALEQEAKALLSCSDVISTHDLSQVYENIEQDIAKEKEKQRQALISAITKSKADLSELCTRHGLFCITAFDNSLVPGLGSKSQDDLLSIQKKLDETHTARKADIEKIIMTKSSLKKRLDEIIEKLNSYFKNLLLLAESKDLMARLERTQSKIDIATLDTEISKLETTVETSIQKKSVRKPLLPVTQQTAGYFSSDGMFYPDYESACLAGKAPAPNTPVLQAYHNHRQPTKPLAKSTTSEMVKVPDNDGFRNSFG